MFFNLQCINDENHAEMDGRNNAAYVALVGAKAVFHKRGVFAGLRRGV